MSDDDWDTVRETTPRCSYSSPPHAPHPVVLVCLHLRGNCLGQAGWCRPVVPWGTLPTADASLTRSLSTWCLSAGSGLCEQRVREGAALWRKQVQHAYPTFSSLFLLVTPEKNLTRGLARWRRRPQERRGRRRRHVRAPARGQGERRVKVERQVGRSSPPPPPFLSH